MPTLYNLGGQSGGYLGFGGGFGDSTVSDIGGAVSDFFQAGAYKFRAKGARIEEEEYTQAAALSDLNAQYTKESTDLKTYQEGRKANLTLGEQAADVATNNFESSGSALDLLRDSASQGAITQAVIEQQGLVEQKGYEEQAASYRLMASAAETAAKADDQAATGSMWAAGLKGAAAIATLL
jgi:hypothetical protein